jgi:hypothetical protein
MGSNAILVDGLSVQVVQFKPDLVVLTALSRTSHGFREPPEFQRRGVSGPATHRMVPRRSNEAAMCQTVTRNKSGPGSVPLPLHRIIGEILGCHGSYTEEIPANGAGRGCDARPRRCWGRHDIRGQPTAPGLDRSPLARLSETWAAQLSDFHHDDLFSVVPLRKAG